VGGHDATMNQTTTGQYPAQPGELYLIFVSADAFRVCAQPFRQKAAGLSLDAAGTGFVEDLGGVVVSATNLAFSVELYLKGWVSEGLQSAAEARPQSAATVYADLPKDLTQSVEAMYAATPKPAATWGLHFAMDAPSAAPAVDYSLTSILERSSRVFEAWRYLYESGEKPAFEFQYLGAVADALYVHAQQFMRERIQVKRG
jgi:hypothetical protein